MPRLAAHNFFGPKFSRRFLLHLVGFPTRDKRRRAVHDVEDVRVLFMDFHRSRTAAPARHDLEIVGLKQQSPLGKNGVHLFVSNVDDTFGLHCRINQADRTCGRQRQNGFGY